MPGLCSLKRQLVDHWVFALLEQGLAPNLMSFLAELLGPEGLRRAPPATSVATGQVILGGASPVVVTVVVRSTHHGKCCGELFLILNIYM